MVYLEGQLLLDLSENKTQHDNGYGYSYSIPVALKPKVDRESSLFHWLLSLDPAHSLFKTYPYVNMPGKDADYLLFELSKNPIPTVDRLRSEYIGFIFESHHLRLDKVYTEVCTASLNRALFTFAHYTVSFKNLYNHILTIRIYFNAHGSVVGIVAKKSTPDFETPVQLSSDVLKQLPLFCQIAHTVLMGLIAEKDALCAQALDRSNTLDKETADSLSEFFKERTEKNTLAYIEAGTKFLQAIDEVNFYLESSIDTRGEFVKSMLASVQNMQTLQAAQIAQELQDTVANVRIPKKVKSKTNKSKAQVSKPFKSMGEFKKLMSVFLMMKKTTVAEQIAANKAALILRDEIIGAWFAMSAAEDNSQKTLIQYEKLIVPYCDLTETFKNTLMVSNLEGAKTLFQYISDQTLSEFYRTFLMDLADPKKRREMNVTMYQTRIQICDFLYENSETYRLVLRSFEYLPCKTDTNDAIKFSFLGISIHYLNFALFEMLLRQGCNSFGIGVGVGMKTIGLLPLALVRGAEGMPFAKRLMHAGVSMEYMLPMHSKQNDIIVRFQISPAPGMERTDFENLNAAFETVSEIHSALVVAATFWRRKTPMTHDFIRELALKASFWDLATSILLLSEEKHMHKHLVLTSKNAGIYIVENLAKAECLVAELARSTPLNIAYIYSSLDNSNAELIESIKVLVQLLTEKFNALPKDVEEQLTQSYLQAQRAYLNKQYSQAYLIYKTVVLVCSMKKNVIPEDREKNATLYICMNDCVVADPSISDHEPGHYLRVAEAIRNPYPIQSATQPLRFKR